MPVFLHAYASTILDHHVYALPPQPAPPPAQRLPTNECELMREVYDALEAAIPTLTFRSPFSKTECPAGTGTNEDGIDLQTCLEDKVLKDLMENDGDPELDTSLRWSTNQRPELRARGAYFLESCGRNHTLTDVMIAGGECIAAMKRHKAPADDFEAQFHARWQVWKDAGCRAYIEMYFPALYAIVARVWDDYVLTHELPTIAFMWSEYSDDNAGLVGFVRADAKKYHLSFVDAPGS